jgi:hypothetical protein
MDEQERETKTGVELVATRSSSSGVDEETSNASISGLRSISDSDDRKDARQDDFEGGIGGGHEKAQSLVGWAALTPFVASTTKAFLGSNYLGISFAFSQSGYILGVVGLGVITVTTAHCCFLLVECKRIVQQERQRLHRAGNGGGGSEDLVQYGESNCATAVLQLCRNPPSVHTCMPRLDGANAA